MFFEISKTTIRRDEKGNVIGWEEEEDNKKCAPVRQHKLVTRADYEHPRLISYSHGILEGYKFNVTLNADGTLQVVGSESSPDRGQTLANLTSAAVSGAKIAGGVPAAALGLPPCNDGAVVLDVIPYKEYKAATKGAPAGVGLTSTL